MVIYDTKNNNNGQARGTLYISAYDVDYLVAKYEIYLKNSIPLNYANCFEEEINKRKKEDVLSVQWYAILQLGIESDEDEELLKIISQEVSEGNMVTRKQLQELSEEELDERIAKYPRVHKDIESLPIQDIYRLRSYRLAKFIISGIADANKLVDRLYNDPSPSRKVRDERELLKYSENLVNVGASADIKDSDYFQTPAQLLK